MRDRTDAAAAIGHADPEAFSYPAPRRLPIGITEPALHHASMALASGHQALRRGRYSLSGQIYLLTVVSHRRTPYFANDALARAAAQTLHSQESWGDAHLLCWVLMPDHWHGLVQLADGQDLSRCVNRFKSKTTKALRAHHGLLGSIWQRGFHDHALRQEEDTQDIARYVILNPVRAGLVRHVADYPYWNAAWL